MKSSQNSRSLGFTLIELLVVIAIIAILAAILFPVFAKAREKARQAMCLSNEKQIGLALIQYTQDYDEYWPTRYGAVVNGVQPSWKERIEPYLKSVSVFRCPDNPAANYFGTYPGSQIPAGYAMWLPEDNNFAHILGRPVGDGDASPQNIAGINYPANSLVVVETSWLFADTGPYLGYSEPSPPPTGTPPCCTAPGPSTWNSGHSKNAGNIVFMDGHAKYQTLMSTFTNTFGNDECEWRYSTDWANNNGFSWVNTLYTNLQTYHDTSY